MKTVDVKLDIYINVDIEKNDKGPKFKVGDHVRMPIYKNIFAKGYTSNWSEEVFVVKYVKNNVPCTYVIEDLKGKEAVRTFYEKELQDQSIKV